MRYFARWIFNAREIYNLNAKLFQNFRFDKFLKSLAKIYALRNNDDPIGIFLLKNLFDSKRSEFEFELELEEESIFNISPRTLFLLRTGLREVITRPNFSCRKRGGGGEERGRGGEEESGNGKHAISNSPAVFKIPHRAPSIQFRYRHTHHPPNLIFAVKRRARTYGERRRKKGRGEKKKKKEKKEDPSTVNRAISNFQRSQHTARHLFIFERPRPNQFPFFDSSLDRKLPVSLSLSLFFFLPRKKNTCPHDTEIRMYVCMYVRLTRRTFVSSRNYSKFLISEILIFSIIDNR